MQLPHEQKLARINQLEADKKITAAKAAEWRAIWKIEHAEVLEQKRLWDALTPAQKMQAQIAYAEMANQQQMQQAQLQHERQQAYMASFQHNMDQLRPKTPTQVNVNSDITVHHRNW